MLKRLTGDNYGTEYDALSEAPHDKYHLVWFIFLILGIGLLLPWNAYITPTDYWTYLWPTTSFEFYLSIAYNTPSIVMLLLMIRFGRYINISLRLIVGFAVDFFVLLFIPVITTVLGRNDDSSSASGTDTGSMVSMGLTLAAVFISGVFTSVLFGTVLGLAANFPPTYTTAVMSGNGVAGVIAGFIRILTKVSFPPDPRGEHISSIVYFAVAAACMLICIGSYIAMQFIPFARYHLGLAKEASINGDDDKSSTNLKEINYFGVFKKIWLEAFTVMNVFLATLMMFPGMTLLIPSSNCSFSDWFGIIMIAIFQLFDFIGRTIPRWIVLFTPKTLWIPTAFRYGFFVLFLICINPKVIFINGFPYLFMALFAISNGYCGTLAMMFGPQAVELHEKETAGVIMSFFLNLGIFLAVYLALAVQLVGSPPCVS